MAIQNSKLLVLSAFIGAVSVSTFADDHKYSVHLETGRTFFEDLLGESTNDIGVGFGYNATENWSFEGVLSTYETETDFDPASPATTGIEIDGSQIRFDTLYTFSGESAVRPFLAVGVGREKLDWDLSGVDTQANILANFGGGIKWEVTDFLELRTGFRFFKNFVDSTTDFNISLGVGYLFGESSSSPAPAAKPVAAAAPAPKVVEKDTDGDGVLDSADKCPGTASNYKVDASGCPMELTETVSVELNITFDSGKSVIKPEYVSEVEKLATFMNQYANTMVTVEGHTDNQGADAINTKISQSRADAVKAMLITKFGVAADRVKAIGYGKSKPIADNATAEGRETNRRVVGSVSAATTSKVSK
jgi:OmpA-OmpF porin, OOP family